MHRLDRRVRRILRGREGFTLFEIIMVLLIMGVLSYFVATRVFMDDAPTQRGEFELLKNHLRYAQSRAMNSEDVWGIKCGTSKRCWLFKCADGVDTVKRLPGVESSDGALELKSIQISGTPVVVAFDAFGTPCSPGATCSPLTTSPSISVQAAVGGTAVGTITVTKNTGFIP
jgi:prepilin-type N-terminal cleavage/methylation domain-containing protein